MATVAERRFPIQSETRPIWTTEGRQRIKQFPPFTIPWAVAEIAYQQYSTWFDSGQSLERLAQRGGFGRDELLYLLAGNKDGYFGREAPSPDVSSAGEA